MGGLSGCSGSGGATEKQLFGQRGSLLPPSRPLQDPLFSPEGPVRVSCPDGDGGASGLTLGLLSRLPPHLQPDAVHMLKKDRDCPLPTPQCC